MKPRLFFALGLLFTLGATLTLSVRATAQAARKPNVVFILADDLGYGDLGCYGQKEIRTPNLDRMAAEGVRFTNAYAGCTVCAPSRCALMTGKHTGHTTIRGNGAPEVPLRADETCVAEVFKKAGYATGIVGKWGCGPGGTTGEPNKKGFDYFFGYFTQREAHNYYPEQLWQNGRPYPLKNIVENGVSTNKAQYTPDLCLREGLKFIDDHQREPFFLYYSSTVPHANNEAKKKGMEIPSDAPYSDKPWPQPEKNFAAMVTRLDGDVGKLLAKLKEHGLDRDTLVIFSSDNGAHREGGHEPDFFHSSGPLRGIKRDLYEGGIRVPTIARWPGKIDPGGVSNYAWAFWDFLPTVAQLVGQPAPKGIDGLPMLSALVGKPVQGKVPAHDFLYWEFHENGFHQAVRMGNWKYVRQGGKGPELYDLSTDEGEKTDVAAAHPDVMAKIEAYLKTARVDSPHWPVKGN